MPCISAIIQYPVMAIVIMSFKFKLALLCCLRCELYVVKLTVPPPAELNPLRICFQFQFGAMNLGCLCYVICNESHDIMLSYWMHLLAWVLSGYVFNSIWKCWRICFLIAENAKLVDDIQK